MFCFVFLILCLVSGVALIIAGGAASSSIHTSSAAFLILLIIGTVLVGFAPVFYLIGSCIIRIRRTAKMRQAIAEESRKYSTRSPTACDWRLHDRRIWTGGYGRMNQVLHVYSVSSY